MQIHRTLGIGLLAAATVCVCAQMTPAVYAASSDQKIKLNGCLVKGEKDDGYLITNLPSEPGSAAADKSVTTSAIGTAGNFATVFYWLRRERGSEETRRTSRGSRGRSKGGSQGRRDQTRPQGQLDRTRSEVRRSLDEGAGPQRVHLPGSLARQDQKINAIVRKVDVDHVRMLAASCE